MTELWTKLRRAKQRGYFSTARYHVAAGTGTHASVGPLNHLEDKKRKANMQKEKKKETSSTVVEAKGPAGRDLECLAQASNDLWAVLSPSSGLHVATARVPETRKVHKDASDAVVGCV